MISHQISLLVDRFNHRQESSNRLISLIILVIMLSVSPIGYHIIVLNVPSTVIQRAISDEFMARYKVEMSGTVLDLTWSFVVSCQSIGALVGCFLVMPIEKRFGTKRSLLLLNNLLLVAASFMFMLISFRINVLALLTVGRLLVGLYTGIGCALVPVYVQELSPHQYKGALCCFVHIAICAGSALGAFLSMENLLGGPSAWTALLSLPIILALAQIFLNYFLMENPSFFLRRNDLPAAARSIRSLYSFADCMDMNSAINEYHSLVTKMPPQISLHKSFLDPKMRNQILLGMAISMAQIFSGSMAAVSFSTTMLESVSFTAWLTPFIPTLGSLLSIAMTLPALRLIDSCGRKQLLVNTLTICAVANFMLVLFSLLAQLFAGKTHRQQSWASFGFLLCFFLYGIAYNVGVGPIAYFLPAELVPPNAVSAAMGTATAVNWLSSMLTTIVYYPLNELIGGWSFMMFALPTTFFAIFFHRELPGDIGDEATENSGEGTSSSNGSPPSPTMYQPSPSAMPTTSMYQQPNNNCPVDGHDDTLTKTMQVLPQQPQKRQNSLERMPLQHQTSWASAESTAASWYSTFETPTSQ